MKSLFIFDGTALAYRSHFAFIKNPLINSQGQHTSALYGVISSFLKIYEQYKPEYVAISFDKREKTFRHQLSADYKANRPIMPDELVSQIDAIGEFFALAGVKEISQSGYEADDMIGSLAVKFAKSPTLRGSGGCEADGVGAVATMPSSPLSVVIVSKDKDFAQLVKENITLYDLKNEKFITAEDIYTKWEVLPSQFIDYLALVGDASDNIPGAKGVGPKTATKLLNQYQTLDNLYTHLSEIKEKDKLSASKDDVYLSKTLATIKTDVPLDDINCESLIFHPHSLQNAIPLLERYELRNLVKKIEKMSEGRPQMADLRQQTADIIQQTADIRPQTLDFRPQMIDDKEQTQDLTQLSTINYQLLTSTQTLRFILSSTSSDIIALDTETTSTDSLSAELVGISFCLGPDIAYYIPISHTFAENMDYREVLAIFKDFLRGKTIIGHNIKYDMQVLERYNFDIETMITLPIVEGDNHIPNPQPLNPYPLIFDTMLAAYILDPGKNEYSLSSCAKRELDYDMMPITDLIGTGKKQLSFANVDLDKACQYSAEDALVTYRLYQIYYDRLKAQNLYDLYTQIEIPLIFTLSYMEKQGVHIDSNVLNKLSVDISMKIDTLIKDIHHLAGETFNINSPQQLSQVLFEKLKIDPVKKIKTGYSTDIEVLEALADKHDIAKLLIEYRHLTKMKNTYIDALPQLVNPHTMRIHTSFNQTITSTGRLSSSNPNLQNIPIKTELGKQIRQAFTATKGKLIVAADYSQIELRLLAALSDDESMLNAFRNGIDIHTNTAEKIGNVDRRKAKVINFGIIYGMGANSLAKELGISHSEAKTFIDNYFHSFPTIRAYIENQKFSAHQNAFVQTIYGRKLFLSDINSSNQRIVSEVERVAVNMPIQGSAADIIKIAMNNIYKKIAQRDDIKMLIQVHDELVFEVDETSLIEACTLIKEEMEKALIEQYSKKVALVVDIGYGHSWAEAH